MYRLLKLTSLRKCPSDVSRMTGIGVTEKTCLLCKQINNLRPSYTRSQSTITNPDINSKRIRKRRRRKYAELLVVTDSSSSQHKATIQKLTSNDVKLLATTNLNLSELYKLKEFSKNTVFPEGHTYNNLNIIENIPSPSSSSNVDEFSNLNSEDDDKVLLYNIPNTIPPKVDGSSREFVEAAIESSDEIDTLPAILNATTEFEMDLESIDLVSTFQPEETEEHITETEEVRESTESKPRVLLNKNYRNEISSRTLAAFIEVCSTLKNPQKGLNALNYHRAKAKKSEKTFTPIKNIKVYNTLLRGFANKAQYLKVKEVLKMMEEDGVELNLQSYVAIFECLGRINVKNNHLRDIRNFTKKALANQITYDVMMNKGIFLNCERDIVLHAMKSCDPHYVPKYDIPEVFYNNNLLNHLNCDSQLNFQLQQKNDDGMLKPEEMDNSVLKQIALEREGYVTIKSIECRGDPTEEVLTYRKTLQDQYKMWEEAAFAAFNRDLLALTAQRSALNFEPYMRCIPQKDYIAIIIERG